MGYYYTQTQYKEYAYKSQLFPLVKFEEVDALDI